MILRWALALILLANGLAWGDWPQYRYDAARSGFVKGSLPARMSLHWAYQAGGPPTPAWIGEDTRMPFDHAFRPVVANGTVYFGSSVDCKIYALDAETARERWTFFTDAPVRFAPAVWKDRLFAVSDDGLLYCLSAATGEFLWTHRGGPNEDMVLGNNRMVSRWPARGGPVIADDVLYYAAGIWPSEGIFIYALNPATGEVIWENTDSGTLEWDQPHPGARAESGISAQGYLAVTDEDLLVPTGRGVPASFSKTGELKYFHLQRYGHAGGADIVAMASCFFNRGHLFDTNTGDLRGQVAASCAVATPGDTVIYADGKNIAARRVVERETFDRRGEPTKIKQLEPALLWPDDREWLTAGRKGKAIRFDGQGDYLALMSPFAGEPTTFSAWIKVSQDEPDAARIGVMLGSYPDPLCVDWEIHQNGRPRIYWNKGEVDWRADADLRTGEWAHIAFVRDKAADKIFFYLNGRLTDTHEGAGSDIEPETAFFMGADKRGTSVPYFKGEIDELAIFNRPMAAEEVAALCEKGPDKEGLIFHVTADGAADDDLLISDESGMHNHAVLQRERPIEAPHDVTALIAVGDSLVLGGADCVSVIEKRENGGGVKWTAAVEGTVLGLAFSDGRLYASTDLGGIYCFGNKGPEIPVSVVAHPEYPSYDDKTDRAAAEIVKLTGVSRGYAVDLGCGDGALSYWLARHTDLHIIAIDSDPEKVELARRNLDAAGLYGSRVTVHHGDPDNAPYPDYFADLVVSGRSITQASVSPTAEMQRLQRPYGGIICMGKPGTMYVKERGALEGSGEWTHQYSNASATGISDDIIVKSPLGMLWFTDFEDMPMPDRHGRPPAPLFGDGRLFVMGLNSLYAINAYNGRVLWEHPFEGILTAYDQEHITGAAITQGVHCVGDGSVFVRFKNKCVRIDSATGQKTGEYLADKDEDTTWGYVAFNDGILFGTAADTEHVVTWTWARAADMEDLHSESKTLFALDPETGKRLWTYEAKDSIRNNTIVIGDGRIYLIDRPKADMDRLERYRREGGRLTFEGEDSVHPPGRLIALDSATGETLWDTDENVYGTMLAYGPDHDVLLMSYQRTHAFILRSELGGRFAGFRGSDGKRLWDVEADYRGRPLINGGTIYAQPGAWDLVTGERTDFALQRSYGCGIVAGCRTMLTFRSATLGFRDLSQEETENYGGIRPGCWINAIPAGGLVLLPDATSGCTCSYLNKAFIALQTM